MKKILTFILLAVLSMAGHAADNQGNFGVRAAFDINIPGKWHVNDNSIGMYKSGCGFTVGGVYWLPVGKGFYVEPGLSFVYDTYAYDDLHILGDNGVMVSDPGIRKFGLRLPVIVGYEFGITDTWRLAVFTGPELNYTFTGKIHVKEKELLGDDFPDNVVGKGGQRRFDCAWKFGIGFPLDMFWVSIDGAIGMTDLMPGNVTFRENRASVALTYYF